MPRWTCAVALALLAGPAGAEGYSVLDLGEMPSRKTCMQRASKVMNAYLRQAGGWEVTATEWIVYGWDLGPGDNAVTILCPIFRDDLDNAMMVVHGEEAPGAATGDAAAAQADADREQAATALDALWFR